MDPRFGRLQMEQVYLTYETQSIPYQGFPNGSYFTTVFPSMASVVEIEDEDSIDVNASEYILISK